MEVARRQVCYYRAWRWLLRVLFARSDGEVLRSTVLRECGTAGSEGHALCMRCRRSREENAADGEAKGGGPLGSGTRR